MARALPFDKLTEKAYVAIFSVHELLSLAMQEPSLKSQPEARKLLPQLLEVSDGLQHEVERLVTEKLPKLWSMAADR
jgi:hypothetical protein